MPDRRVMLLRSGMLVLLLCHLPQLDLGRSETQGAKGRTFDISRLDAALWGIGEGQVERIRAQLALGSTFFGGAKREAFLEKLDANPAKERIEIGWILAKDGRYVGVLLSRTKAQIEKMSDAEFTSWRTSWTVQGELEWRRFRPLPTEIRGYGGVKARAPGLENTRRLMAASSKRDFLESVKARIKNAYISILFVPKGGQGPTMYSFSTTKLAALSEAQFGTWRRRCAQRKGRSRCRVPAKSRSRLKQFAESIEHTADRRRNKK